MQKITGEDTENNSQMVQSSIKLAICVSQTSVEKIVSRYELYDCVKNILGQCFVSILFSVLQPYILIFFHLLLIMLYIRRCC